MASKGNSNPTWFKLFDSLGTVMNKVGVAGFVVISIVVYVFWFVPSDQKREITNTWLLFKGQAGFTSSVFVVASLILILVFQMIFCSKNARLMNDRIQEIAKEKTELQQHLLKTNLKSSVRKQ